MNSGASISDLDRAIIVVIKNLEERSEEPISFWKKVSEEYPLSSILKQSPTESNY
jgi:hypothetical protein